MEQVVKITSITNVTHDVLKIRTENPGTISFKPGQAADISINKGLWKNEVRPFTFTSLPTDDHLEFTIKTYPERKGVTNELLHLMAGDELVIHGVFGDIGYKGEGIFIAGGAGVTPFIAIFKQLQAENKIGDNKLIFANKTKADIILENEFGEMLGDHFINILSGEMIPGYEHGYVSAALIQKQISDRTSCFYVCGPDPMMDVVENELASLGVGKDRIVRESF